MRRLQHIGLIWGLALKDLWNDKFVSLCVVASLVAVIAHVSGLGLSRPRGNLVARKLLQARQIP